jgi:hypothetical protein
LETGVAALLLITASVAFACVVVDFAVSSMEQTLNMTNIPQLDRLKSIENNLMNQTDPFSLSQPQLTSSPPP